MRFRVAAVALALFAATPFLLAGCDSVTRLSGDNFEAAHVPFGTFEADTASCRQKGNDKITYDVRLIDATSYARNRAFNATYAACMKGKGYVPRPWLKNVLPNPSAW